MDAAEKAFKELSNALFRDAIAFLVRKLYADCRKMLKNAKIDL